MVLRDVRTEYIEFGYGDRIVSQYFHIEGKSSFSQLLVIQKPKVMSVVLLRVCSSDDGTVTQLIDRSRDNVFTAAGVTFVNETEQSRRLVDTATMLRATQNATSVEQRWIEFNGALTSSMVSVMLCVWPLWVSNRTLDFVDWEVVRAGWIGVDGDYSPRILHRTCDYLREDDRQYES